MFKVNEWRFLTHGFAQKICVSTAPYQGPHWCCSFWRVFKPVSHFSYIFEFSSLSVPCFIFSSLLHVRYLVSCSIPCFMFYTLFHVLYLIHMLYLASCSLNAFITLVRTTILQIALHSSHCSTFHSFIILHVAFIFLCSFTPHSKNSVTLCTLIFCPCWRRSFFSALKIYSITQWPCRPPG